MLIKRLIREKLTSTKKSVLLLGPRQTGKSTLIGQMAPSLEINLADQEAYIRFLGDPGLLRRIVGKHKSIMIDEIQRIPSLLNTIQALIDENNSRRFWLTGSSARKLRRGEANLLPGRLHAYFLGPLSPLELGNEFEVMKGCRRGLLPDPYLDRDESSAQKTLKTYAATYLREEIQAEALTRNLEGFSRFLNIAAAWSGDFLDFSKMSSLAEIDRASAKRFFEILEETLVVQRLEAFAKSEKVRLIQHSRFYFFDVGVLNGIMRSFDTSTDRMGRLFEHLVIQSIRSTAQALDKDVRMSVFRTSAGAEVDLILEEGQNVFAIEIKATRKVSLDDFKGLSQFTRYFKKKHRSFVVSLDPLQQEFSEGMALPLSKLWSELEWRADL